MFAIHIGAVIRTERDTVSTTLIYFSSARSTIGKAAPLSPTAETTQSISIKERQHSQQRTLIRMVPATIPLHPTQPVLFQEDAHTHTAYQCVYERDFYKSQSTTIGLANSLSSNWIDVHDLIINILPVSSKQKQMREDSKKKKQSKN